MPYKQSQLKVFQNERAFKAPDTSEIALGPQKFNRSAETNGPGSNATATFFHGASSAVMHKTLSEQWFYIDGPEFYLWLCPEDKSIHEGKFYKVSAGSKIEVPPRTKFQIYNPSFEEVQVLMVTNPFWPQDETAMDEIAFPEGPWHREDTIEFQADVVPEDYMDRIYNEDPIAQNSSSGFDYIDQALRSIGENPDNYSIVGDSWFAFDGDTTFRSMPVPESTPVTPALGLDDLKAMNDDIEAFEVQLHKRKQDGIQAFKNGMRFYEAGFYSEADNYFCLARRLGNPDGAYYEGLLFECGEGHEIDVEKALSCYRTAASLGHYGAFKQAGEQLYSCWSHQEMWLRMTSSKLEYLRKVEEYTAQLKESGQALFIAKDFKGALREYQAASRISPDNASLYFNQGLCQKKLGIDEEAISAFEKALEIDPSYLKAQYQIELLNNGHSQNAQSLFNQWRDEHQLRAAATATSTECEASNSENKLSA